MTCIIIAAAAVVIYVVALALNFIAIYKIFDGR